MPYKFYLICFILLVFNSLSFADDFISKKDGSWTDTGNWNPSSDYPNESNDNAKIDNNDSLYISSGNYTIGNLTFDNNGIIYVASGASLTVDSIYVKNNGKMYIEGSLNVNGGVDMQNNSTLEVDLAGTVTVDGDFAGGNGVTLLVDGDLEIAGDFEIGTGASIAGDGSITVDGDVDMPTGTDPDGLVNGGLPVILVSYMVSIIDQNIIIEWATVSEINNDYFTIERSIDGINFQELTIVRGAGSTQESQRYSYIDQHPVFGISYYRLKQTDFDGTCEIFRMVAVNNVLSGEGLSLYPNPTADGTVTIRTNGLRKYEIVNISVSDLNGRIVRSYEIDADGQGMVYQELDLTASTGQGIYIMSLRQGSIQQNSRLVVR